MGETEDEKSSQAGQLFENFVQASTCKGTLQAFNILCRQLELDPSDHRNFYSRLKAKVTSWKAKGLWSKLDKRAVHKEYKKGKACIGTKCLIIGGGPCGLRTAIELALLGAKAVVIEKRDTFSRNNVLHLWPYTIHDLRGLGAKKFYGKFCAGSIDHISIRQLQLMLLKIALIVGVEIHVNVEFIKLLEPPEDQENEGPGWRAEVRPADHPVADFDFEVIVGADGRRNTLEGFRRKEFRGKLAIAITANFINRNTTAEAKVEEISGVAFIFNQKFFLELKEETGVDLENIVYYKDNTHYFVMTAKKQSLLDKGVIVNDYIDTEMLLSGENVNQEALLSYAREAADFGTNYQLPSLDYAMNHYGQPDVAMFDFTCMYASENAALVRERFGHRLLVALVGDSLLEPFWPMGTGCARGFLAAFDTAWMVKAWAQGRAPLEILAERESLYRLLPQTTPENITKNFEQYTIDPGTRYPNLNSSCVRPHQVRHLYITGELQPCTLERSASVSRPVNLARRESEVRPSRLLTWCQKHTEGYRNVDVCDLTSSWKSGLALCALIHSFRADLIDFDSLIEEDCAKNNQLAFNIAEREFGISPITTGTEMAANQGPDKLSMVMYLSKFYEMFRGAPLPAADSRRETNENREDYSGKPANSIYNLKNLSLPRKRIPKGDHKSEDNDSSKRRRKFSNYLEEATNLSSQNANSAPESGELLKENKVKFMATQLLAKFEENAASCSLRRQGSLRREFPSSLGGSDTCHFCRRRVYVMERLSAEGLFFHRECLRCATCSCTLRLGSHAFDCAQGKFYCKVHFAQQKALTKQRRWTVEIRKEDLEARTPEDSGTTSPDGSVPHSAAGSPDSQPPGWYCQLMQGGPEACRDTHETCGLGSIPAAEGVGIQATEGIAPLRTHSCSSSEGLNGTDDTHSSPPGIARGPAGAEKGESAEPSGLPVTAVASCDQGAAPGGHRTRVVGVVEPEKTSADGGGTPVGSPSLVSRGVPCKESGSGGPLGAETLSAAKRTLTLSLSEREKLLDWDAGAPERPDALGEGTAPEVGALDPGSTPSQLQPQPQPESPQSPLQWVASALRRSFGSSAAGLSVDEGQRNRPPSQGSFRWSSLFWGRTQTPREEHPEEAGRAVQPPPAGRITPTAERRDPRVSDLPGLLESVSLSPGSRKVSRDDMVIPPPRSLNFFSSLRLKRSGEIERRASDSQEKDIWSIVAQLRNRVSSRERQETSSSSCSSEDDERPVAKQKEGLSLKEGRQERTEGRQVRQEQLKRLHRAQVIQRQLEEVEEKQKTLEEKGVTLEKMLRGETAGGSGDTSHLLQTWYHLVLEKNGLVEYESELTIFAQELELEDNQSELQQKLRRRMAIDDSRKSPQELAEEQEMFAEMMRLVEQRDTLVAKLDGKRLGESGAGRNLETLVHRFHWT
ncbi:F-actin-monooxygenase MICAL2 isoform X2 [Scleropages formosus]|uniref:F-actin-monooxygenase MICAL2 isoform X2 n=1 Tax=Scleropages formosus TaxID=113540 RepID=UPI0010FACE54|nr:F-actin-monooxygenase MICAL2 isoform X2 [Scleropages formosus]